MRRIISENYITREKRIIRNIASNLKSLRSTFELLTLLASLNSTEDFYRYKALHYEALVGDKKDRESVRVNDQYRIEFHSEIVGNEKQITICNILELSNHYK